MISKHCNRVYIFTICSLFLTITAAWSVDKKVRADVESVTLYQSAAMVKNVLKVDLEAGKSTLIVGNIPLNVNPQSIQVGGKGDHTLLGVQFRTNPYVSQKRTQAFEQLEDSIQNITYLRDSITQINEIYRKTEEMILSNKAVGGANSGIKTLEVEDLADLYVERLPQMRARILRNNLKLSKLDALLQWLNQRYSEAQQQQNVGKGEIVLEFLSNMAHPAKIELQFLCYDAGWSPTYDIKAKDVKSPVQLILKAQAWQNTGTQWENVHFTFSTGNPVLGGNKPNLNPWYIQMYQPPVPTSKVYRGNLQKKAEAASMEMSAEEVPTLQSAPGTLQNYIETKHSTFTTLYDVALPYSLMSSGLAQQIELKTVFLPAVFAYQAVPKLDFDAFLMAKITEFERLNLTPGNAQVFYEGNFIGETYFDPQSTSDTLQVSLGRDKRIVVKREQIMEFSSKKFFGQFKKEEFGYQIQVKNAHKDPISIEVEDQIPVSQDAQIEIEDVDVFGAQWQKESGKISWKLILQPNETISNRFKFAVKYPKDKQIQGL